MKTSGIKIMSFVSVLLASISVISCLKQNASTKLSDAGVQVVYGNWDDIRNGQTASNVDCVEAGDRKFIEHITLPTSYRGKPDGDVRLHFGLRQEGN